MEPVVMFDGTCNFCDAAVHFVLDREAGSVLKFAALQSDAAREILEEALGREDALALRGEGDPNSVVFVEGGRVYTHSAASLRITRYLRWPWRWLAVLVVVPRPIRDFFYRWFARNRYRWFGKTEACRVPTPALRARFLG
ncbi:MAG: thiol-disulfide oxidoreductase DCC family protein [Labilithrix sp.]|nr:thiol-disulfide oxidoreductase DCC family protein [Labilithrix sp.]